MRLTESDVENTEFLEKALDARSKADAMSQALAIARTVIASMVRGDDVLLRSPGKDVAERLIIPRLRGAVAG